MKYLLDTDHISLLQQSSGPAFDALVARIATHDRSDLAPSVIRFQEQVLGCHTYINRACTPEDVVRGYQMLRRLRSDYAAAPLLPFDSSAAAVFERMRQRGVRISSMDLRIAAIAIAHGYTLVTRNARDFQKVPGLHLEDWTR